MISIFMGTFTIFLKGTGGKFCYEKKKMILVYFPAKKEKCFKRVYSSSSTNTGGNIQPQVVVKET